MTELMIAVIGACTTLISGILSWMLARRKYNTEVDSNLIANMENSLNFYRKLSDDNKVRLNEVLKRNDELQKQVDELRSQVFSLMATICTDLTCQFRKRDGKIISNQ